MTTATNTEVLLQAPVLPEFGANQLKQTIGASVHRWIAAMTEECLARVPQCTLGPASGFDPRVTPNEWQSAGGRRLSGQFVMGLGCASRVWEPYSAETSSACNPFTALRRSQKISSTSPRKV